MYYYVISLIVIDIIVFIVCRKLIYKNKEDEILEDIISEKNSLFNFSRRNFNDRYNSIEKKYGFLEDNENELKMELYRLENIKVSLESNTNAIAFAGLVLFITLIMTGIFDITNFINDNELFKECLDSYGILFIKVLFFSVYLIITVVVVLSFTRYAGMIKIYDLAIKVLNDIKSKTKEQKSKQEELYEKNIDKLAVIDKLPIKKKIEEELAIESIKKNELFQTKEKSIIGYLIEVLPLIKIILPEDCMFTVSDKEKLVYYIPGREIDAKVSVGDSISEQDGLYKCQQTGERIVRILSAEVYGVPIKSSSFPIKDKEGHVIGAFSIGLSIDKQKILHEYSQAIASTVEEISTTTEELTNISTNLAQDLNFLMKVGDTVIDEISKTSEILQFVNEIATGSNLLGLNASIEAARAGDSGKGFAVVASEIQKMASNSTKSVKDVSIILKSIETSVSNMVNALIGVAKIREKQASATEKISASIEELTSSAINIEKNIRNNCLI